MSLASEATEFFQDSQCFSSPRAPDRGYGLCIYVSTGHEGYNEEADSDRTQTLANSAAHRHLSSMGLVEYLPSTRDMLTDGDDAAGPKSSQVHARRLTAWPLVHEARVDVVTNRSRASHHIGVPSRHDAC